MRSIRGRRPTGYHADNGAQQQPFGQVALILKATAGDRAADRALQPGNQLPKRCSARRGGGRIFGGTLPHARRYPSLLWPVAAAQAPTSPEQHELFHLDPRRTPRRTRRGRAHGHEAQTQHCCHEPQGNQPPGCSSAGTGAQAGCEFRTAQSSGDTGMGHVHDAGRNDTQAGGRPGVGSIIVGLLLLLFLNDNRVLRCGSVREKGASPQECQVGEPSSERNDRHPGLAYAARLGFSTLPRIGVSGVQERRTTLFRYHSFAAQFKAELVRRQSRRHGPR